MDGDIDLNIYNFQKLLDLKKEIQNIKSEQHNCNSDIVYWSFQTSIESKEAQLEELKSEIIKDHFQEYEEYKNRLLEMKNKISKIKEDLNLYKPAGYKQIIALLKII